MKSLELHLQKRLLIVEKQIEVNEKNIDITESLIFGIEKLMKGKAKFICKGSELTENKAKIFVHQSIYTHLFAHYVKDIPVNTYCHRNALDSFISAIESKGYHWEKNPYNNYDWEQLQKWNESESRTFRPEKTLIFEIL